MATAYQQVIQANLFDEHKPITYKWLAYELNVPTDVSKMMLAAFVKKLSDDAKQKVNVNVLVSGSPKSGDASSPVNRTFKVCRLADVEKESSKLSKVDSMHIHSLQMVEPADSPVEIWNVDYENSKKLTVDEELSGRNFRTNLLGSVRYKDLDVSTLKQKVSAPKVEAQVFSKSKDTTGLSKSKSTKVKAMSSANFFAMKKTTSKTLEAQKPEKVQAQKSKKTTTGSSTNASKPSANAAKTPKPTTTTKPKKESPATDTKRDACAKPATSQASEATHVSSTPTPPTAASDITSEKNKKKNKKRKVVEDSDEEEDEFHMDVSSAKADETIPEKSTKTATKKKKKAIVESDDEDAAQWERDQQEIKEQAKEEKRLAKEQRKLEKKAEREKIKDELRQLKEEQDKLEKEKFLSQIGGTTKRTKKKLVSKTYMDDKGYLVTEDIWEEVEDDSPEAVNPVKVAATVAEGKKKKNGARPTAAKEDDNPAAKKKAKQTSLFSFAFKKK